MPEHSPAELRRLAESVAWPERDDVPDALLWAAETIERLRTQVDILTKQRDKLVNFSVQWDHIRSWYIRIGTTIIRNLPTQAEARSSVFEDLGLNAIAAMASETEAPR